MGHSEVYFILPAIRMILTAFISMERVEIITNFTYSSIDAVL